MMPMMATSNISMCFRTLDIRINLAAKRKTFLHWTMATPVDSANDPTSLQAASGFDMLQEARRRQSIFTSTQHKTKGVPKCKQNDIYIYIYTVYSNRGWYSEGTPGVAIL